MSPVASFKFLFLFFCCGFINDKTWSADTSQHFTHEDSDNLRDMISGQDRLSSRRKLTKL